MKVIGRTVGAILFLGSGLFMAWFWFSSFVNWFGFILGIFIAMIASPGVVIFPFVFWIVEGAFPVFFFVLWILSIIGAVTLGFSLEE